MSRMSSTKDAAAIMTPHRGSPLKKAPTTTPAPAKRGSMPAISPAAMEARPKGAQLSPTRTRQRSRPAAKAAISNRCFVVLVPCFFRSMAPL